MSPADWVELEPGVWGLSTPGGLDFVIEDVSNQDAGKQEFQASQLLRTCCSSYEHHLKRFGALEDAMKFVEDMAQGQEEPPCPAEDCRSTGPGGRCGS